MKPLEITVQQAGEAGELAGNIRSALARDLPEFAPSCCKHDGTFVLVASGWSMPGFIDEIKAHRDAGRTIVAVKSAHDFLVEHGVRPDLYVNLDPRDRTKGVTLKNDTTVYLIASRCPPVMFDHLADKKVVVWHSWAEGEELQAIGGKKLCVGGGTTSGMRAINLGYLLGFRKFVLYGYDSCNRFDGVKRFTGEMTGDTIDVYVGEHKRKFTCNMAMAQQANEFQLIYGVMPDITIEAKGDGLIAEILKTRRELKFAA
jgi:uncharacterized Rossmann fold enzyme